MLFSGLRYCISSQGKDLRCLTVIDASGSDQDQSAGLRRLRQLRLEPARICTANSAADGMQLECRVAIVVEANGPVFFHARYQSRRVYRNDLAILVAVLESLRQCHEASTSLLPTMSGLSG